MSTRIPLPGIERNGLFEGLMAGHKNRNEQQREQRLQALFPTQLALMNAQVEQQKAEAQQLNFLREFLMGNASEMFGGQSNGANSNQQDIAPGYGEPPIGLNNPNYPDSPVNAKNFADDDQDFGWLPGMDAQAQQPQANKGKLPFPKPTGDPNKMTPLQRAALKAYTKLDIPEDPEDVDARKLNLHKSKKEYDKEQAENTPLDIPTAPTLNQAQSTIIATNTVLPLMYDILEEEIPGKWTGRLTPTKKAFVDAMANLNQDELMAIFSLPKDKETGHKIEQMVTRQSGESEEGFKKRFEYLIDRVLHKRELSNDVISNKKVKIVNDPREQKYTKLHTKKESTGKPHDPLGIR